MNLKKLTLGELVTAAAGVLLTVFSFFHWYSVDLGPFGSVSRNGWQSPDAFWSVVAILIGILLAARVIATRLANVSLPDQLGSLGWGMVHFIGGGVAFVFILIKWLSNTDFTAFGLYASLVCAAGLAVGGYLIAKERGELPAALRGGPGRSPGNPSA